MLFIRYSQIQTRGMNFRWQKVFLGTFHNSRLSVSMVQSTPFKIRRQKTYCEPELTKQFFIRQVFSHPSGCPSTLIVGQDVIAVVSALRAVHRESMEFNESLCCSLWEHTRAHTQFIRQAKSHFYSHTKTCLANIGWIPKTLFRKALSCGVDYELASSPPHVVHYLSIREPIGMKPPFR